jgi:AcrR family transcriptional regulator
LTRKQNVSSVYIVVKPQKTYHHGNLRAELVSAALEAIAESGPEGFTLRDVARRAGVSPAAPYRHFPHKEALLEAVAVECGTRMEAAVSAALDRAPDDPLERFRATGIALVRFAVENPAHFRVLCLPSITAAMPVALRTRLAQGSDAEKLGAQLGLSGQRLEDTLLAARCLVHGLAHLLVSGQEGFAGITVDQAEALAHTVTGVFGEGLLPRPPAATGKVRRAKASARSRG